jgi:outer membrane protein
MNNRLPIILSIASLIFASVVAFKVFNTSAPVTTKPTKVVDSISPSTAAAQGLNIVFVNIDTLNAKYKGYIIAKQNADGKVARLEKELKVKENTLIKEEEDMYRVGQGYEQKINNMTELDKIKARDDINKRQTALAQKQESYMKFKDQETQKILKAQDDINVTLRNNIMSYLDKLANEKGYDYILTFSAETPVLLYGNSLFNITDEVVIDLNKNYQNK